MRQRPVVPCGRDCPDRTAECKFTCKKWDRYEKEYADFEAERSKSTNVVAAYKSELFRRKKRR